MTSTASRDLGNGVRVMPGDGGGIVVQSADFDLGWRPRIKGAPGAAVIWAGTTFEVVERERWRRGGRWILVPWTGEDVMRVVLPLDEASVGAAALAAETTVRGDKLRPWLVFLSPILGFATGDRQRRWRDEWGYPAVLGTWLSALFELALGGACIMELIASTRGGLTIFSWIPRPLIYFGLPLCVDAIVRMMMVASDSEPIGSLVGEAASTFGARADPVSDPIQAPEVRVFDPAEGSLEIVSPILRRDWEGPGLMPYRGEFFALDSAESLGSDWVYSFRRLETEEVWDGPRLRLIPTASKLERRTFEDQPGLMRMILLTIACTLAPRKFQERWAWESGVGEKWLTVMGATAELLGGLSNLSASGGGSALIDLLNLFFVGEALVRFGSVVFKGQACGSVVGFLLVPILERTLPEPGLPEQDQKGLAR